MEYSIMEYYVKKNPKGYPDDDRLFKDEKNEQKILARVFRL